MNFKIHHAKSQFQGKDQKTLSSQSKDSQRRALHPQKIV